MGEKFPALLPPARAYAVIPRAARNLFFTRGLEGSFEQRNRDSQRRRGKDRKK